MTVKRLRNLLGNSQSFHLGKEAVLNRMDSTKEANLPSADYKIYSKNGQTVVAVNDTEHLPADLAMKFFEEIKTALGNSLCFTTFLIIYHAQEEHMRALSIPGDPLVCITVPTDFDITQRREILAAAERSGLRVLRLVEVSYFSF